MPTFEFVTVNTDYAAEREFNVQPSGNPHWPKVDDVDFDNPTLTDYVTANNANGDRERYNFVSVTPGFGAIDKFIVQFAYDGVAAGTLPGLRVSFRKAGVEVYSEDLLLNSLGALSYAQVSVDGLDFEESDFNNMSIRFEAIDGVAAHVPDTPEFQE